MTVIFYGFTPVDDEQLPEPFVEHGIKNRHIDLRQPHVYFRAYTIKTRGIVSDIPLQCYIEFTHCDFILTPSRFTWRSPRKFVQIAVPWYTGTLNAAETPRTDHRSISKYDHSDYGPPVCTMDIFNLASFDILFNICIDT